MAIVVLRVAISPLLVRVYGRGGRFNVTPLTVRGYDYSDYFSKKVAIGLYKCRSIQYTLSNKIEFYLLEFDYEFF